MPRFYLPPSDLRGKTFTLSGSEAHHAIHVLRKKAGDLIDLFDGKDAAYTGRIESVSDQEIRGSILEEFPAAASPVELTLYQALTRGSKWEWMLEKVCEVGVTRVIPVITQRTLIKLDASGAAEKLKRWNRIALAASKQSGRASLMTVETPLPLATAVSELDPKSLSLIPWEKEAETSIHHALSKSIPHPNPLPSRERVAKPGEGWSSVNLFIGPEGGWDEQEIELAIRAGVIPVRLGPTLLRTETAGLIAATLVLREFGVY